MIGNKIASKIPKVSRNSTRNISETVESETEISKERYISPEKGKKIVDDLRLINIIIQ